MAIWILSLARSRDKLKPVYLHYHSNYDHQIWQGNDLPWADFTHKVAQPFVHMVLLEHMAD